ncbi:hypothetical protein GIY30_06980 [Gordonia sp. HNM0687]|uniref:Uncharacterized protein n=1 Tax=Gordonia mangrovi TaxID=2665643 RepID=A0A6L7GMH9_9ACTN|nr:hypothetical protein [Gordonia mangrovi]MDY6811899.1 hypothetical protein [Actinomycetota bacterium]MXP21096.1 hypothetical protein [Gordonia mangrovi]UVF78365.1 hypothetical protein NWF22_00250 [Gordonia mangrovi]
MTSDDTTGRGDDNVAGHSRGPGGDPLRDFLLGLAAQIDQLAAMFGGPGPRHSTGTGRQRAGTSDAAADVADLVDLSGEITSLLAELGDLLARLIAALIAVLEAIARALRSTPPTGPRAGNGYQQIAVRIDTRRPSDVGRPQPEGED